MKLKKLYFFNFRGLRLFSSPKAITNMSLVFFLILFLPLVIRVTGKSPQSALPEKREPTPKSHIQSASLRQYFQQYNQRYNEHFLFRDHLVRVGNVIRLKLFGVSPVARVIVGKEGWLFQARRNLEPNEAGYFLSILPFKESELEQWRRLLEQRQRWLKAKGIYYLLILAPDKSTIYPEFLPNSLRRFYNPQESRLVQLVRYLEKHSTVPVLNLRDALLASKKEFLLYYKTDSHWNDYGACIAYGEIIKHLAAVFETPKTIMPKDVPVFRLKKRPMKEGNLAMMLFVPDGFFREDRINLISRGPRQWRAAALPSVFIPPTVKSSAAQCPGADFPNAVMLHDSFGRHLKHFLSGHFSRILYLRDWGFHFHAKIIAAEEPEIVMDEIAEHFLYNQTLSNPEEVVRHDR